MSREFSGFATFFRTAKKYFLPRSKNVLALKYWSIGNPRKKSGSKIFFHLGEKSFWKKYFEKNIFKIFTKKNENVFSKNISRFFLEKISENKFGANFSKNVGNFRDFFLGIFEKNHDFFLRILKCLKISRKIMIFVSKFWIFWILDFFYF